MLTDEDSEVTLVHFQLLFCALVLMYCLLFLHLLNNWFTRKHYKTLDSVA